MLKTKFRVYISNNLSFQTWQISKTGETLLFEFLEFLFALLFSIHCCIGGTLLLLKKTVIFLSYRWEFAFENPAFRIKIRYL